MPGFLLLIYTMEGVHPYPFINSLLCESLNMFPSLAVCESIMLGFIMYKSSFLNPDFPVYHTAFDSFNWMINFADPFFWRHVAG